jgi:hypothetical protein
MEFLSLKVAVASFGKFDLWIRKSCRRWYLSWTEETKDVNDFLLDFFADAKTVLEDGLKYGGKVIVVTIAALVCDAPARCFATNVVSHSVYYGCHKCTNEGVWIRNNLPTNHGGRVTFPRINDRLRRNESFRSRSQPRHHKQGRSIIEQ